MAAPSGASMKDIVRQAQSELERTLISRALEETDGNVTRAAKKLQISRKSLQVKMKELGLRGIDDA
jgi:DNA-binding NtrC family response regulator